MSDFTALLRAAYRVECDDAEWLRGLLTSANTFMNEGLGLVGILFEKQRGGHIRVLQDAAVGPRWLLPKFRAVTATLAASDVDELYDCVHCNTMSAVLGSKLERYMQPVGGSVGVADALGFVARSDGPQGCAFVSALGRVAAAPAEKQSAWSLVADHIMTAARLRQLFSAFIDDPAGMASRGLIQDALDEAQRVLARKRLHASVVAFDRIRRHVEREPAHVNGSRSGPGPAGWAVVDKFEVDGKRYMLAREREPAAQGSAQLTARERQVAALAGLGHSPKVIAFDLEVAHSTVRVLLARAMRKLGVRSLNELRETLSPKEL